MFSTITFFCCLATLTLFGHAAWTDRKSRLIANRVSVSICALFAVWVVAGMAVEGEMVVSIQSHLTAALVTFVITFGLWTLGYFGGGDVKLVTALALWAGLENLVPVFLLVTVAGGLMALILLLLSKYLPYTAEIVFGGSASKDASITALPTDELSPPQLGEGALSHAKASPSVPYGIAISIGGAWTVLQIIAQYGLA